MLAGALGYFVFANFTFLEPTKPFVNTFIAYITPFLIFAQLLLTFCKVDWRELMPSPWHGWLLLFQVVSASALAALLIFIPMDGSYREVFEAAMVCLICPTATAAAVITGKLGGSASSLTTYTLLSNILAAIAVPLIFPLVEPHADITFFTAFLKILGKVFPLLLFPFFLALFFRYVLPKVHHFLLGFHDLAFYLWGMALAIVTGQTVKSLMTSDVPPVRLWDKRIQCWLFGWLILIWILFPRWVRAPMFCGRTFLIAGSCGRSGRKKKCYKTIRKGPLNFLCG